MKFHHTDRCSQGHRTLLARPSRSTAGSISPASSGSTPRPTELVEGGFEAQTRQVLQNIREVLSAAGCTFADIVKTTVYLIDFADFPVMNQLYGEAMGDHRPARTTVQVAALPKGGRVEIDVTARVR